MNSILNKWGSSKAIFCLSLVACHFLLSSCGFHLRGAVVLPEQMTNTYVQGVGEAEPLYEAIRLALEDAGGAVVERQAASAVLNIALARFDRRVLSVDSTGLASEYELNFLLRFSLQSTSLQSKSLQDSEQHLLVPIQTLSISRAYSFDSSNVLGKSGEEALLREEMLRVAIRQMMQQLQMSLMSSSSTNSLPTSSPPNSSSPAVNP